MNADAVRNIRQAMLDGPVLPTMLRLAGPTTAVLVIQSVVSVAETAFIGLLGTNALAGAALVFPVLGLMVMMSNGGIGGGVSSAIARALGAGKRDDADALLWHALILAILFGAGFSLLMQSFGQVFYEFLGGSGESLTAAMAYSNWVFAFAIPLWAVNLLAAGLRGSGNVVLPARITIGGAIVTLLISPAMIIGIGPFPRMGVAGAGIALGLYYSGALLVLIICLLRGNTGLHLRPVHLEARHMHDILRVGLISALGTLQTNITNLLLTGAAGLFGAEVLAGFGVALRLEYLLLPVLLGLGSALVAMVGTNVGAGQQERARAIAWYGAAIGGLFCAAIGLLVSIAPEDSWMRLFSQDPAVLRTGAAYLTRVGPFYAAFGLGMEIYFASQGAGRPITLFLAGTVRLLIAACGGWVAILWFNMSANALYWLIGTGMLAFGYICLSALRHPKWGERLVAL